MNLNGESVLDELTSFKELSSFNDQIIAELFSEEDDTVQFRVKQLADKIESETAGMEYQEAVNYYNDNVAESLWSLIPRAAKFVGGLLGGGGDGSQAKSSSTSSGGTATTSGGNIEFNPVIQVTPTVTQTPVQTTSQAPVQRSSSSSGSSSRSYSRSQTANQFNPQFNPYLNFNPYLIQQQAQQYQQQQIPGWVAPIPVPQPPQPLNPCPPCPPVPQIMPAPQQNPSPQQQTSQNVSQQIMNALSNPQAMSMLTNMISNNLNASRSTGFRESLSEADEDAAEFLPIIGAIASAVVPSLIQAAPSIIKGIGGMFSGRGKRPQQRQARRYTPPPNRFIPGRPPVPSPATTSVPPQVAPSPAAGIGGMLSGALPQLMSLIQNPQITGALGNLLNTGVSALTNMGAENVPISEAAFLNAIAEYAQMAAEDLENLGMGDNLGYMKDSAGEWKYDPNISTYRAESLLETIQS
jgi:hypothetical protein